MISIRCGQPVSKWHNYLMEYEFNDCNYSRDSSLMESDELDKVIEVKTAWVFMFQTESIRPSP